MYVNSIPVHVTSYGGGGAIPNIHWAAYIGKKIIGKKN